jgi:hypothetical protein
MMLDNARRADEPVSQPGNVVYCDGGLCNRLNALIYALVLRDRFGHDWSLSWPQNNWCGAAFGSMFSIDMPVLGHSLQNYRHLQDDYLFLMHENQTGFRADRIVYNHTLPTLEAFGAHLNAGRPVFYFHNLFPHLMDVALLKKALGHLRVNEAIWDRAWAFCRKHGVDRSVRGLHIRKTDFGNAVNDAQLFDAVAVNPGRFFVCSDDREVNQRFGALTNCCVLEKTHFPRKVLAAGDWNASTTDSEGRRFPYNIERPEDSVVEALVDLLILSATTPLSVSGSTFLGMATIFSAVAFFTP